MTHLRRVRVTWCLALLACGPAPAQQAAAAAEYLYLWTASADSTQPDFLAVLDVTETSGRYGRLVTTLPVPGLQNIPHHTEHQMPADRQLFANGFATGPDLRLRPQGSAPPTRRGPVRRRRGLHPPAFVPAAPRRPRARHLPDAARERHHGARRSGGAHRRRPTGALEVGQCSGPRFRDPRLQRRRRTRPRPDRHDDDRHARTLPRLTPAPDLATLRSHPAAHDHAAGRARRRRVDDDRGAQGARRRPHGAGLHLQLRALPDAGARRGHSRRAGWWRRSPESRRAIAPFRWWRATTTW